MLFLSVRLLVPKSCPFFNSCIVSLWDKMKSLEQDKYKTIKLFEQGLQNRIKIFTDNTSNDVQSPGPVIWEVSP